jgi:hypothetical protein
VRLASQSENFPYTDPTVCFLEVDRRGQVTSPLGHGASARVRAGESTLYAVWPGHYRSDLFLIDDIETYEKAIGLQPDPQRTGLQEHEHQVEWTLDPSETSPRGSYVTVQATLSCGCQIRNLRTFAAHMKSQRGWDVAVTGGWGSSHPVDSPGTYYFRVRRKSLD